MGSFEYWLLVGVVAMSGIGLDSLRRIWRDSETAGEKRGAWIVTVVYLASLGMIFLGRGDFAPTENVQLEGEVEDANQKALETELRNQKQLVFQTRAELEVSRQKNKVLQAQIELEQHRKEVDALSKDMESFRKRLMNRDHKSAIDDLAGPSKTEK